MSGRYEGLGTLSDLSKLKANANLTPEEIAQARKEAKMEMEKLKPQKAKGKGKK